MMSAKLRIAARRTPKQIKKRRDDQRREALVPLAERLAAAYVSYQMGYKGVDYALKRQGSERIGEPWISLAEHTFKLVARAHR